MASTPSRIIALTSFCIGMGLARSASAESSVEDMYKMFDEQLAVQGGLTADEVARRAVATSPDLLARRDELEAAAADVEKATLAYVPVTTVRARYTRLSDLGSSSFGTLVAAPGAPPGPLPAGTQLVNVPLKLETPTDEISFQASLLIPVSDYFLRVAPSRDGAKFAEKSAKSQVGVARLSAAADARIAYYSWVRARLGTIVAEQAAAQARGHLKDAQTGLAAGTTSQADVMRVESQLARAELLVASSEHLSVLTEEQVRITMHVEDLRPFAIGEDVRPRIDTHPAPLPKLLAEAYSRRPEIAAFDAGLSARDKSISVERAGYAPRLDLFADAEYANPNQRVFPTTTDFRGTWDAGAQLTWTLSDIPTTSATVSGSVARQRAAERDRTALLDRIRLEVLAATQACDEAGVAQGTSERGLAAAEESYRTRNLLYQNGRATTIELVDAETDVTRARLEALNARIDARVARIRLHYALGRDACLTAELRRGNLASHGESCQ